MNYLAHLLLSGDNDEIKLGNFIADAVKGKNYKVFSTNIQTGIILHRKIDYFTDNHQITKELSFTLREKYKKHSGIVVDIFYDYFLANNWEEYSEQKFENFISNTHALLIHNYKILPPKIKRVLPFLIAKKRLLSYKKIIGISDVLTAMSKYTSLPYETDFAIKILTENYDEFNTKFNHFYKEIDQYVKEELSSISKLLYS
ncbi:MAG: DUF479 domain-containing protein [Bacteroidales bacterium]|nr:DUF479 domain-containing protein [Bacteroidales bacterium]MBN2758106.1 DUF479 domain-containing protein [Bacteroidales bacterium]